MPLRLADFILRDMALIVADWERFASTQLPAAASMDSLALRDHAVEILEAVAKDLQTPQNREEQQQKSEGRAPGLVNTEETAAQTHALLRARSGFSVTQLAAEYRALRASVLRLWMDDCSPYVPHLDDIIRFNEAIDQALAESLAFFTNRVKLSRNLFLGMLGNDLRRPLRAIHMIANYLSTVDAGDHVAATVQRLSGNVSRMHALLDNLMNFNRTELGLGISITRSRMDLATLCAGELDEIRPTYPSHQINLQVVGDVQGYWDERAMGQLVANLITNAVKYATAGPLVEVTILGGANEVRLAVKSKGNTIDPQKLDGLFEPLPDDVQETNGDNTLALGLYSVREIARAHQGDIAVSSENGETIFGVRLPRL